MLTRFLVPGIISLAVMLGILMLPKDDSQVLVCGGFTLDNYLYAFSFWVLSHVWLTGLNKQRKHNGLRRRAKLYVISGTIFLSILIEILQWLFVNGRIFNFTDIIFAIIGSFIGLASFYLLYRECC